MRRTLELVAPAKINLTLEVLHKRDDGYHELATVMQTIDLCDRVRIEDADEISLQVMGPAAGGAPADVTQDLAHRAAMRMAYWLKEPRGARIRVEKHIPAGRGLGGGSSDAAAVIRGLNLLWGLDREPSSLTRSAAEMGSDAPFFIHGGSALCRGRGEKVDPLADCRPADLTLFLPAETIEGKTAALYAEITRDDFSAGTTTRGVVDDIAMRGEVTDVRNVFDRHCAKFGENVAVAMEACNVAGFEVHLAGSGPAFFALRPKSQLGARELGLMDYLRIDVREHRFLSREDALAVRDATVG